MIRNSLIEKIHSLSEHSGTGIYVSILDSNGDLALCLKSGDVFSACFDLSLKKANTAYAFKSDNDFIYGKLLENGQQSLITESYCFIPGGICAEGEGEKNIYIGVSTQNPDIDKHIAIEISKFINGAIS